MRRETRQLSLAEALVGGGKGRGAPVVSSFFCKLVTAAGLRRGRAWRSITQARAPASRRQAASCSSLRSASFLCSARCAMLR